MLIQQPQMKKESVIEEVPSIKQTTIARRTLTNKMIFSKII